MNRPKITIDLYGAGKFLLFLLIWFVEEVIGIGLAKEGFMEPYRAGGAITVLEMATFWLFYLQGKRL